MKLKRKAIVGVLCLFVLFAAVFTACRKENSNPETAPAPPGKQKVSIYLNDDPVPHLSKVLVDIRYVEVKVDTTKNYSDDDDVYNEDHDGDDDHNHGDRFGTWDTLSITPMVYDLLQLKNGIDTVIADGFANIGKITKIRVTLGPDNTVWTDSTHSFPLPICTESPYVYIKVPGKSIDQLPTGNYRIRMDFDVARSIKDKHGKFCLRPVIKSYSDNSSGKMEGKVEPKEARAKILVFNDTDTAYAIPEKNGEFKIRGLNPAVYSVSYLGTDPYGDTTISNVEVKQAAKVELPVITLHK